MTYLAAALAFFVLCLACLVRRLRGECRRQRETIAMLDNDVTELGGILFDFKTKREDEQRLDPYRSEFGEYL